MNMSRNFVSTCSILLLILVGCDCQTGTSLTEPKLTAVIPLNSTALSVSWEFASSQLDQSDLIRVTIDFYEFFTNYGSNLTSRNYVFTPSNRTITSIVENFQYVNIFYYVCFSSNSTSTSISNFLYLRTCRLVRTCSRANPSICPQNGFTIATPSTITSNSFIITVHWLNNLPYIRDATIVKLAGNGATGTPLASSTNSTYTSLPFQFTGLQSQTSYTVDIFGNFTLFGSSLTNMTSLSVTTSRSSNLVYTGNIASFVLWSVLLSWLFS